MRKKMYTSLNPSFIIWKWGLSGSKLYMYRLVFVMFKLAYTKYIGKTSYNVYREDRCPLPWVFSFPTVVTLKIRSRLPKSIKFFDMSQLYSQENLVRIQPLVQKILCRQESITSFSVFLLPLPWKLGQGHQNLTNSLLCSSYISMQIW